MTASIYISPRGDDSADGSSFAPVKSFTAALRLLKKLNSGDFLDGSELVLQGDIALSEPLLLTAEADYGLTVRPADGRAAITSAKPLQPIERNESGRRVWCVALPELRQGAQYRTLLVNGASAPRPRLPREGFYEIKRVDNIDFEKTKSDPEYKNELFKCTDRFYVNQSEWAGILHTEEVELVIPHYWADEHATVQSYDPAEGLVVMNEVSSYSLADDFVERYSRYAIENVREAARKGDWYLRRESGELVYLPTDGQTLENTVLSLPTLKTGVLLEGARNIRFTDIDFTGFDWELPRYSRPSLKAVFGKDCACYGQSASGAPAGVQLFHSSYCRFDNCRFSEIGGYGIGVGEGCSNIGIHGCELFNIGAGGVRVTGGDATSEKREQTRGVAVVGCHIHDCSRVFMAGCGILSMHANNCRYADNDIHSVIYTGISVGWVWGYAPSVSHHNIIENNRIYDIGNGLLSDMGGIYTLGEQPGTVLRGNVIHDVRGRNYGGWGIYPDEGSSYLVIENNICYNTSSQAFHQHYGRENTVRNNIFAFGGAGSVAFTRPEAHCSVNFYNNTVLTDGRPAFICRSNKMEQMIFNSDCNLFYDYSGAGFAAADGDNDGCTVFSTCRVWDMEGWRKLCGRDLHSEYRDPGFADPKHGDFSPKRN